MYTRQARRLIRKAIDENMVVHVEYVSQYRGYPHATSRDIEPLELEGYLVTSYCRLRQAERHFRLDRIKAAHLTGEQFSPRSRHPPRGINAPLQRTPNEKALGTEKDGCLATLLVIGGGIVLMWLGM